MAVENNGYELTYIGCFDKSLDSSKTLQVIWFIKYTQPGKIGIW